MRKNSQNTSTLIATVLLLCALALSGCTGAVVGVGTAAVAASTTEKGFSTSVSDGVIFAKLKDRFIQDIVSDPRHLVVHNAIQKQMEEAKEK